MIKRTLSAALVALMPGLAFGEQVPIVFEHTEVGSLTDPTGLFSDEELKDGGSVVQPSIWYSTFSVEGGQVIMTVLFDAWCGVRECPVRYRLVADSGLELDSHQSPDFGMICQDTDSMTVDPVELVIRACDAEIDLKQIF